MPVAKMPGDAHQMLWIASFDLEQRLGRRDHFNQPPIVEHQRVAAAQCNHVFQIEQEFEAARARHRHAPAVTVVEIEHDGVGRRFGPAMLASNLRRAYHASILWGMISAQTLRVCRRENRWPLCANAAMLVRIMPVSYPPCRP
jgi:hypothetical protein